MNGRFPAFALLLLAACLVSACVATTRELTGTYEAVLPAASAGGERHVRVTLKPGGEAAVSSAFSDRPSRFLLQGTWREDGNRLEVNLESPRAERLVFRQRGPQLVAQEWDHATWGTEGPGVLTRIFR